jgi:uncharacterized protein (TIGR02996 family)
MHATEKGLLQAIADDPDDSHRLVYADWLEDNGDPQRAEFIRLQVARAALHEDHPDSLRLAEREASLLAANEARWKEKLPPEFREVVHFDRGLPAHLKATSTWFLRHGEAARRALRADSLALSNNTRKRMKQVFAHGALEGLRHLELCFYNCGGHEGIALAKCDRLKGLASLKLRWSVFAEEVWGPLGRCELMQGVTRLDADWCKPSLLTALFGPGGPPDLRHLKLSFGPSSVIDLSCLAASDHFALEELSLSGGALPEGGLQPLGALPADSLRTLTLWFHPVGDAGAADIAEAAPLGRLECLKCYGGGIGPVGAAALARSPHLRRLLSLDLTHCPIGDAGLAALTEGPWAGLRVLDLAETEITDTGLAALARSPLLGNIQSLDLSRNKQVTGRGIAELAQSPHARRLDFLWLGFVPGGDEAARAIAESPHLSALRVLSLAGTGIGLEGVSALARSPHLTGLRRLHLADNHLGKKGAEVLLSSPLLGRLSRLDIGGNRIPKALRDRLDQEISDRQAL